MVRAAVVCAAAAFASAEESSFRRPRHANAALMEAAVVDAACAHTYTTTALPLDDYFRGAGCSSQVHVGVAGPRSAVVVFATPVSADSVVSYRRVDAPQKALRGAKTADRFTAVMGSARSYTALLYADKKLTNAPMGPSPATGAEVHAVGNAASWAEAGWSADRPPLVADKSGLEPTGFFAYQNPASFYSSPVIHHVFLEDLVPGARYEYAVSAHGEYRAFTFPKAGFPFQLGLVGDVGQTQVSNRSLEALRLLEPDAVLVAGDLAYADGWGFRWDTFGALSERLFARVPILTVGGNHEVINGEAWQAYTKRYPTPAKSSGSPSPLFWSVDVGPAHVIGLNSYDNFVHGGDAVQRKWLEADLARIDRAATPWVLVLMHAPFYSSNTAHVREAELMRAAYEPLLYAAGVDVVIAGHVHAYERTSPVYDFLQDDCGLVHLGLGDGGNYEGPNAAWQDDQPDWSAFREASFGVGSLRFVNATHAYYEWKRDACVDEVDCAQPLDGGEAHNSVDQIWVRRRGKCHNKRAKPPAPPLPPRKRVKRILRQPLVSLALVLCGALSFLAFGALFSYAVAARKAGGCGFGARADALRHRCSDFDVAARVTFAHQPAQPGRPNKSHFVRIPDTAAPYGTAERPGRPVTPDKDSPPRYKPSDPPPR